MVATGYPLFTHWGTFIGLMVFVFLQTLVPHIGGKERYKAGLRNGDESGCFITAFDLSSERNLRFTWPIESMRPAPYESVLMVVEKMPRVFDESGRNSHSRPLLASRHLKINGRLQRPLRASPTRDGTGSVNKAETFLVRLAQGRLNLELTIPAGTRFDPQHKAAKIKLYETAKRPNSSLKGNDAWPARTFSEFFGVFHQFFQYISPSRLLESPCLWQSGVISVALLPKQFRHQERQP